MPVAVMTQELLDKWVAAIPLYKKTADCLRGPIYETDLDGDRYPTPEIGYCCLGVLADIIDVDRWESNYDQTFCWNDSEDGILGRWLDLGEQISFVDGLPVDVQEALAEINDASTSWEPVIDKIKELVVPAPELPL